MRQIIYLPKWKSSRTRDQAENFFSETKSSELFQQYVWFLLDLSAVIWRKLRKEAKQVVSEVERYQLKYLMQYHIPLVSPAGDIQHN